MAKTVDNFATIEDFRKQYNELAYDVGDTVGLNAALKGGSNDTIVDALNVLDNKQFFLQEYVYVATANQVTFTGNDSFSTTLLFRKDKIQVFKNERHLVEDVDYIVASPDGAGNHESVVLQGTYASGQANAMSAGDRLLIYSYTGAFIGTEITGTASSFFQKSGSGNNEIYNSNAGGIILNGDNSSATTTLESGYTVQLAGKTFAEDDIISTVSGKKVQFPTVSDGTASLSSGSITGAVNITASGELEGGSLDINGVADISGNTLLGGTLGVTGTTTLTGLLDANGSVDLGSAISDTISFIGTVDTNITPNTNNTQQVGISSRKFNKMYATDFHGNLTGNVTGNADTATALATARNISGVAFNGTANIELNTSHIDEDSSNLYYTDARADARANARIAASTAGALSDINYTSSPTAGQILVWDAGNSYWEPANNSNTTDSVSEGSNNKYFTDDRVNSVVQAGNGLSKTFNGGSDVLNGTSTLSVATSNGVKLDGNDVELDYEVITDSDLSGGLPSGTGSDPVGRLYFLI